MVIQMDINGKAKNTISLDKKYDGIKFILPNYVGMYEVVEGIHFSTTKKPNFIHRFFSKLLLGWKWVDNK